jgi:SpoVK/Ycf46/Vps4 family AAA+-type ATPase
MISLEYILYPYIINNVGNMTTGNTIIDAILIGLFVIIIFTVDTRNFKNYIMRKFKEKFMIDENNTITFTNESTERSLRFKSLMYYLSKSNSPSIKSIKERCYFQWESDQDDFVEKESEYEIYQEEVFKFTDDISGQVTQETKEKVKFQERTEYKDVYTLKIFSKTKSLTEIQDWIAEQVKVYKKYIRSKTCNNQLLVSVAYNQSEKNIDIESYEWISTVTFENSYFHDKDKILKKIDFFLNNKKWYQEHGIPYNLGILLYGEPGGGKTRFIKQLMNYTGRHGIDIKLNDSFDFYKLKNLIHDEQVGDDYIISQDKRIIIFEDIDAVGDILKERDDNNTDMFKEILTDDENSNKNNKKRTKDLLRLIEKKQNTNTLSYFLNIIDGLNECSGRIIIMTTNRINHLDKALIRPGRIDIKIEFNKCTLYDIYHMLCLFWKDECKKYSISVKDLYPSLNNKYTSAEIISIFRRSDNFDEIKYNFIQK